MRPRLVFIAIIAFFAYLLGAKAGTRRYKEITKFFSSFWNSPTFTKARKQAAKDAEKGRKIAAKRAKKKFG